MGLLVTTHGASILGQLVRRRSTAKEPGQHVGRQSLDVFRGREVNSLLCRSLGSRAYILDLLVSGCIVKPVTFTDGAEGVGLLVV